jgi:hypothetical protein
VWACTDEGVLSGFAPTNVHQRLGRAARQVEAEARTSEERFRILVER